MRSVVVHNANDNAACPRGNFLQGGALQIPLFGFRFEVTHLASVSRVDPIGERCMFWESTDWRDADTVEARAASSFLEDLWQSRHWYQSILSRSCWGAYKRAFGGDAR